MPRETPDEADFEQLVRRARALITSGRRSLLGICGPPGAGKSTVALAIADRLGDAAIVVPMDGFHLANAELDRLGRRRWKGAPDTFDAHGFVALLNRLVDQREETIYAPEFRREIEEPIAGTIPIHRHIPLVIIEGNYLLLDEPPWTSVRTYLTECWYLDQRDEDRLSLLIDRHVRHGKSPDAAAEWVHRTDELNARRIAQTRFRADLVVRLDATGAGPP
jgi:pantothenate kinase